jgi:hypothetical protein
VFGKINNTGRKRIAWLASKCSLADKGCKRHQIPVLRLAETGDPTSTKSGE